MDLLAESPEFKLRDSSWPIYARSPQMPPHFVGPMASIENSSVTEGCEVYGSVKHSVLFAGVVIEEGAVVEDSVIMPNTTIKRGAIVKKSMIAENCIIGPGAFVGADGDGVALIGNDTNLPAGYIVKAGDQVDNDIIKEREASK